MTAFRPWWVAFAAIVQRDARIYLTYRLRFVSTIVSLFFSLALFYYVSRLVGVKAFSNPDQYFAFVVVGLFVMQNLTATLVAVPQGIRQELVAGTFERHLISPFGPLSAVTAMTIFPFVSALITGTAMIVIAVLVFGMPLEFATAPLALPIVVLGGLAMFPFALVVAASVMAFKQGAPGIGFIIAGISLVGGFLFPVALLPWWLEWASKVQPFTPIVELQRRLLLGSGLSESAWFALLKISAFAVILLPPAVWLLSSAIRRGQRKGTITEY
jgi:ABC-2 type transport system permease protein